MKYGKLQGKGEVIRGGVGDVLEDCVGVALSECPVKEKLKWAKASLNKVEEGLKWGSTHVGLEICFNWELFRCI